MSALVLENRETTANVTPEDPVQLRFNLIVLALLEKATIPSYSLPLFSLFLCVCVCVFFYVYCLLKTGRDSRILNEYWTTDAKKGEGEESLFKRERHSIIFRVRIPFLVVFVQVGD